MSNRMDGRPKIGWLQAQALQCIALALKAKDPRIKRLYTLEAERWLHLAELKADHNFRYNRASEYEGVERRTTVRHLARKAGVFLWSGMRSSNARSETSRPPALGYHSRMRFFCRPSLT
jgi:hypothetical protein